MSDTDKCSEKRGRGVRGNTDRGDLFRGEDPGTPSAKHTFEQRCERRMRLRVQERRTLRGQKTEPKHGAEWGIHRAGLRNSQTPRVTVVW